MGPCSDLFSLNPGALLRDENRSWSLGGCRAAGDRALNPAAWGSEVGVWLFPSLPRVPTQEDSFVSAPSLLTGLLIELRLPNPASPLTAAAVRSRAPRQEGLGQFAPELKLILKDGNWLRTRKWGLFVPFFTLSFSPSLNSGIHGVFTPAATAFSVPQVQRLTSRVLSRVVAWGHSLEIRAESHRSGCSNVGGDPE